MILVTIWVAFALAFPALFITMSVIPANFCGHHEPGEGKDHCITSVRDTGIVFCVVIVILVAMVCLSSPGECAKIAGWNRRQRQ